MTTIMIIDDDQHIGNMLEEVLNKEGYKVLRAYSGTEALLLLEKERPNLALLDLMLPGLSGEEVLPRLRGIPVIVISARADVDSKVKLLLGGAADYVTKPFQIRELLARIAARLRGGSGETVLACQELRLDTRTRSVTLQDREVKLTRTEYAILKLLLLNPRQVLTKSQLLEDISQDTPDCTENSLKIHVSNLRRKLREAGEGRDYIESVWGVGFKLRQQEKG